MSGATIISQRGKLYEISLSTPCINFASEPNGPPPGGPTVEQRYHAEAERRFQEELAPFQPVLDEELPVLARAHPAIGLIPLRDELPKVLGQAEWSRRDFLKNGQRPCRCWFPMHAAPPGSGAPPLEGGSIELAFAALPTPAALERFANEVVQLVYRIRDQDHRTRAELARFGAPGEGAFHYRLGPEGIEDLNGTADGRPLPELNQVPARAGLELAAALAAILSIAEEDGAIHPDLEPGDVRVGLDTVAIQGFGTTRQREVGHAPEGRPDFYVGGGDPPDWRQRQRYGLGYLCARLVEAHEPAKTWVAQLMSPRPADRPGPQEAWRRFMTWSRDAPGKRLRDWLDAGPTAPQEPTRRSPSKIPARLVLGSRGILEPCAVCGRPALAGSSVDVPKEGRHRPDCCWRARQRALVRTLVVGTITAVVALGAFLLWRLLR